MHRVFADPATHIMKNSHHEYKSLVKIKFTELWSVKKTDFSKDKLLIEMN